MRRKVKKLGEGRYLPILKTYQLQDAQLKLSDLINKIRVISPSPPKNIEVTNERAEPKKKGYTASHPHLPSQKNQGGKKFCQSI